MYHLQTPDALIKTASDHLEEAAMKSLFWKMDPYDITNTDSLFLRTLIKNTLFHYNNCEEYRRFLQRKGFSRKRILKLRSPQELPFLPTLYLKHHRLVSVPEKKIKVNTTSSGTSGNKSMVGFDLKSLWAGLGMVLAMGKRHKLFSLMPNHYIILGYEYNRRDSRIIMKTTYGQTWFTPALSKTYALSYENGSYVLKLDEVKGQLSRLSRQNFPVRISGFPFHAWRLLNQMKKEGIRLRLPKGSLMTFGGGWKQHYAEKTDKNTLYRLVYEVLGIPEENCREYFGAAEHPVMYCTCSNHHFHMPIYARAVIRDTDTYEPVPFGTPGLVNLITPMMNSAPLVSVMTDDLGILHKGSSCGCGIQTPYLEILGRAGVEDITTCAAGAETILKDAMEEKAYDFI